MQLPPLMVVFVGKDMSINIDIDSEDDELTIQWQILQPEINSSWVDLQDSEMFYGVKN